MGKKISLIPCMNVTNDYAVHFMNEFYKVFPMELVKKRFNPIEYSIIESDFASFFDMGGDPWEFESLIQR